MLLCAADVPHFVERSDGAHGGEGHPEGHGELWPGGVFGRPEERDDELESAEGRSRTGHVRHDSHGGHRTRDGE